MIIEPAQVADVMAWAIAYGSPLPRLQYKSIIAQIVVAEAYVLREAEGGAPLAIVGCLDIVSGQPGEIFFLAPAGGLGRKLVGVCALSRRLLVAADSLRPAGLVCWVRDDNPQGERLARALGFHPTGTGAGWQQWRFVSEPGDEKHRQDLRRRR
ncbi:protein of unknown function [Hyphomicrobium sp. 1Nfss2.1]|uniref:hypothetical protein n=1 Tax=Hyphomicrobium sp. 1Nfss2.1 TaxID=3413936 RepID=UPI003C7E7A0E